MTGCAHLDSYDVNAAKAKAIMTSAEKDPCLDQRVTKEKKMKTKPTLKYQIPSTEPTTEKDLDLLLQFFFRLAVLLCGLSVAAI